METIRSATTPSPRVAANTQSAKAVPAESGVPPAPVASSGNVSNSAAPASTAAPSNSATRDTREKLQALLEQVGSRIQPESRALSFRVNDQIDGVVVSVIDNATEELIRQIPTETMVRLAEKLKELDAESSPPGLLLSDKA